MFKNNIATIAVIFGFAMIIKKITMLENKIKVIENEHTELPVKVKDFAAEDFEELPVELEETIDAYESDKEEELEITDAYESDNEEKVFEESSVELKEMITHLEAEQKKEFITPTPTPSPIPTPTPSPTPSPTPPPQENDSHYEHVTSNAFPSQEFEQPRPLTRTNSASFWIWNVFT